MDAEKNTIQPESVRHAETMSAEPVAAMPASLAALTPVELKKLCRRATFKMDLAIMPILVLMYILNYLDRQNIASAKLAGIEDDLGMSPVDYQTAVSIPFVGYILMQVPSNMIVGKVKWPGVYICGGMAAWGLVSGLMAVVHNYAGLLVARIFIGFLEAVFFPGALFFMSLFYKRDQYALRAAILYSGSQLGNAIGPLFAIGILQLDDERGLEGWRWLFFVEGALTVFFAVASAFVLPNSNKKIIGMNKLELEFVQWNLATDSYSEESPQEITAWKGLVLGVQDIKTWAFMVLLYNIYIAAAVTNFFPSVVAGLGYDRNTTYALTAPPFILCVVVMLINGSISDRRRNRFWHVVGPLTITLAANIIAASTTNIPARYVAMMLMPGSFYSASTVTLTWIIGNLGQPPEKRAAVIALINSITNTPNVWCNYLYFAPPNYTVAFIVNVVGTGIAMAIALVMRIYLRRLNAKLDRSEDLGRHGPTQAQIASGFRYML